MTSSVSFSLLKELGREEKELEKGVTGDSLELEESAEDFIQVDLLHGDILDPLQEGEDFGENLLRVFVFFKAEDVFPELGVEDALNLHLIQLFQGSLEQGVTFEQGIQEVSENEELDEVLEQHRVVLGLPLTGTLDFEGHFVQFD